MTLKRHIHTAALLWGRTVLIFLAAAATGCSSEDDDLIADGTATEQQGGLPVGAIEVAPHDQTLDMAVWGTDSTVHTAPVTNVTVVTPEADFLMPIDTQYLYIEQNDDHEWRTATVSVTRADGTQQQLTLAQPPATRASSGDLHRSFLRHHAVGYSYDAVGGEYCNMNYVRCQLLNRAVIDEIEKKNIFRLLNVNYLNEFEAKHEVFKTFVDYVQNTNFQASVEGQILFAFKGDMNMRLHAFEDGSVETYILHDERKLSRARYTLLTNNITRIIEQYPLLLTSSFRKALRELAATSVSNWRAVDEFLEVYGTHMVVDAELGARLNLDVQVETHKFVEEVNEDFMANVSLAAMFKGNFEQRQKDQIWKVLRDCKCKLDVLGGDLGILDDVVGITIFSDKDINVSPDHLNRWLNSVYFNDNDLENSNVELVNMQVLPIWYLVSDPTLRERIEARVYNNAAAMQRLLGNRNFINVKIPYGTTKYVCRVGNNRYTFTNPEVTEVIVNGRHVATICLEPVPDITTKEYVRVIYPIYEGHVKLSKGLCIYNGRAYSVDWDRSEDIAVDLGAAKDYDGNIYMNSGNLSVTPIPYAEYMDGHLVAGLERPGGIGIDGSLQGTPVKVVKYFNHFYLKDKNRYDNLPNWSYVTTLPEEAPQYPLYFDQTTWKDRMRRDDGYVYIYNSTELGYE